MSAGSRFVSFDSLAPHLIAGDTNQQADAFVRDGLAGTTHRVSVSPAGDCTICRAERAWSGDLSIGRSTRRR
jgi:hypothetical protein